MPASASKNRFTGSDHLHLSVRPLASSARLISASGMLSFDTAPNLRSAYQELLQAQKGSLQRLLLDLREVIRFDATGTATLLELSRDADRRGLRFEVVDQANRPAYVATGLDARLRFVSVRAVELLER